MAAGIESKHGHFFLCSIVSRLSEDSVSARLMIEPGANTAALTVKKYSLVAPGKEM